jgi:TetR/AcrR family transcriptional regulator, regulator of autoinduction and epiphytic fitness
MSRRTRLLPEDRRALAGVLAEAGASAADEPAPGRTDEHTVDGRHLRSERSRQAMVDALLDLLREGTVRPSSSQIAERAGVTQRTLFNQFGDMDSLVTAAAGRHVHRYLELQPAAGTGTVEERVGRYCASLTRLLEETMHLRWAVLINPQTQPTGDRIIRGAMHMTRKRLTEAFAPELEPLEQTTRDEVLDALEMEVDPVVWRLRRLQQELSVDEAREVLQRTMLAVLHDACPLGPAGDADRADALSTLTDRSATP